MKYKVFTYPVPCDGELPELNSFLSSHRVVNVREEIVPLGSGACLVFVVEYLDSPNKGNSRGDPKVDYRKELSEEEFMAFSRLRDVRKELAEKEGTPVYNIFTNAQLAEMVKKKVASRDGLSQISGVGEARIGKYAEAVLAVCSELLNGGAGGPPAVR